MDTERQADQGPDETKFDYAARMQSMRHLYETGHPHWRNPPQGTVAAEVNELALDQISDAQVLKDCPPRTLYSFGFEAEDLICLYGGLRTYLKVLAQQDGEALNIKMIERVARLLLEINPQAVKASKSLASKTDPA